MLKKITMFVGFNILFFAELYFFSTLNPEKHLPLAFLVFLSVVILFTEIMFLKELFCLKVLGPCPACGKLITEKSQVLLSFSSGLASKTYRMRCACGETVDWRVVQR